MTYDVAVREREELEDRLEAFFVDQSSTREVRWHLRRRWVRFQWLRLQDWLAGCLSTSKCPDVRMKRFQSICEKRCPRGYVTAVGYNIHFLTVSLQLCLFTSDFESVSTSTKVSDITKSSNRELHEIAIAMIEKAKSSGFEPAVGTKHHRVWN